MRRKQCEIETYFRDCVEKKRSNNQKKKKKTKIIERESVECGVNEPNTKAKQKISERKNMPRVEKEKETTKRL